jgi:hypothetical protein
MKNAQKGRYHTVGGNSEPEREKGASVLRPLTRRLRCASVREKNSLKRSRLYHQPGKSVT